MSLPDGSAELAHELAKALLGYERDLCIARRVVCMRRAVTTIAMVASVLTAAAGIATRSRASVVYHIATIIVHSATYNPTVRAGLRELEALDVHLRARNAAVRDVDAPVLDATLVRLAADYRTAQLKIQESGAYYTIARALHDYA